MQAKPIVVHASTLIISQALTQHQDGVSLHPELFVWQKQLNTYRQRWFDCCDKTPLGWYAAMCGVSPTAMLAGQCDAIPASSRQCWTVSPYHAQLVRNNVRVMPEGQLTWSTEDAVRLCDTLNPFLSQDGMHLLAVGAALLLCCEEALDAYPLVFGEISGQLLPDRHHEGEDGGHLNRLLSEIQMLLFQHPSLERHQQQMDINGIWLWSPIDLPVQPLTPSLAVASRNPVLQSVAHGNDAALIITEAERLAALLKPQSPLPKRIILAGDGHAVLLSRSWLPRLGKPTWKPTSAKPETELLALLNPA